MNSYLENFGSKSQNGRYFTNILTYLMCNHDVFKIAIYFLAMILLFWIINRLLKFENVRDTSISLFIILGLFTIPSKIYNDTFSWISGFTNYVIGTVLTLIYIFYCSPLLKGEKLERSKLFSIFLLFLGFAGALCIENLTIYNIFFSLFVIIFSFVRFKCVHISNIAYFLGTIVGMLLMLNNSNYRNIFVENKDNIGNRFVLFDLPDIFMKIYTDIIPGYSKIFFFPNLIICLVIMYLYVKCFRNSADSKPPKYAPFFAGVTCAYCMYSLFTCFVQDFVVLSPSYRIRALETAFVFMYLIAIIYMVYVLFDIFSFMRVVLYIVSTIIVTAPFLVVNPVSSRCFFSDYIFWLLVSGELFMQLLKYLGVNNDCFLQYISSVAATFLLSILTYFNICNKYCDNLRIDYFVRQIRAESNNLQFIELPYPAYASDFANVLKDAGRIMKSQNSELEDQYVLYYFEYIGIDPHSVDLSNISYTSLYDFNISHVS